MNKNYNYYFYYLLLAILAYWQVSFFQNMLKWDMVDAYLPWRSYVSECLLNFHFPLWNPYQAYGYPIHADMRTIWAPEIWVVSLFGGYSIYTFSGLFILYTSIAGIGMKLFSNLFLKNEKVAFFTGVVYMLSGYLTGHAQEMASINSFVIIPIVLYQYFKFYDAISLKRGVYFILSIFIMLTSAYQAHSFIMFYLLLLLFGYFIIEMAQERQPKKLKHFVMYHLAFIGIIGMLFLPLIISAYQVLPWVTRLNSGVDLSTISILSFSPQSLLSLILPFAVIRDITFFNTDLSMTNLYFGIIPLVFLLVYFIKRAKNFAFNLIFIFGLFLLIASFGDYTPLRKILFDYVPFMNLFRGSAYFRLFALIGFCIASGFILIKINEYRRQVIIASFIALLTVVLFTIYGFTRVNFSEFSLFKSNYSLVEILTSKSSFYENMFVQGLVQIIFLILFIALLFYNKASYKNMMLLTVINLLLAIQFNVYSTVVSEFKPKNVNRFLNSRPVGFPIPEQILISECTDKSVQEAPLWLNTSMLAKRISGDSFNSFRLDKTSLFINTYVHLKDSVSANQLLYFSNNIKPLSELDTVAQSKNTLFISDSIYSIFKPIASDDSLNISSYEITNFEPNRIEANVDAEKNTFLTLIQTNYKGWKVFIDNKPAEIIESNTIFISTYLPKGKHTIKYVYKNKILIKAFIFSAVVLFILLSIAFYFLYANIKSKKYIYRAVLILGVLLIIYKQFEYRKSIVKYKEIEHQNTGNS